MTCLSLKMTRHLLVLLVVVLTAAAYLPAKGTFQQASDSAVFSENHDEVHMVTSTHRFHPLLHSASGDSAPNSGSVMISPVNDQSVYYGINELVGMRWQFPERVTVESLEGDVASEAKPNYVKSDGISTPKTETHRIKTRSSNSDAVGRPASDFVFPVKPTAFTPKQDVKNCSEDGTDLCVLNVRDYPYHHIERLLQNTTFSFRSYFTEDIVRVATRFDSSTDDEVTCDAEETILYPKFGKTAANEMLFIINTEGKYKQGIRVEKCKKSGESPCNPKLETPNGYRTYCKQKYIYRKLLALHPSGEPAPDNFRIPSCCSCYISKET